MSRSSPLAAPMAPYALHYDLPHMRARRGNRDRRTQYGIPLPPRVTPSPVLIEHEPPPPSFPHVQSPRVEELRIITPRYAETVVVPSAPQQLDTGIEQRISVQDRNIEMLLDRAVRIKEDLVSALGRTNSTLQEERYARELLQQHVNVMVLICQKLTQEVEFLWYELRKREGGSNAAITNLRQLELSHVANIADVKGRAENMEATLTHLGRDLQALADRGRYSEKQWQQLMQQHLERYFGLDGRLAQMSTKMDANYNESMILIKQLDKDIDNRLSGMEGQLRSALDTMRTELAASKTGMQNQIEQLDAQYQQILARQQEDYIRRLRELEKNSFEAITLGGRQANEVQRRVLTLEQRVKSLEQVVAEQVINMIEPRFAEIKDDLQRMFRDVRDAIDNLEHVEDGKMKLLEDRIAKEVGELRKFVVLV